MVNCLCAFLHKIWPASRCPKPPSSSSPIAETRKPSNMAESRQFKRTSSMVSEQRFEFDVFLSFRGEDTRHGFTKHIYEELIRMGIRTFFDNEELERGDKIGPRLASGIQGSEIFVPVFSEQYANSRWCLMELSDIVKCGRLIIPIFIHVDPMNVLNQQGSYGLALPDFEKRFGVTTVDEWREALRVAGNAPGFQLHDDSEEGQLIENAVKRIMTKLKNPPLDLPKHFIGMEPKVQDVMKLLESDANDVIMVAIHGRQGIGKTTLAKAIYNRIFLTFDAFCFLPNVKETSDQGGLTSLQNQVVCELLKVKDSSISDVDKGINVIKDKVSKGTVFIVLDGVDHESQLNAVAGDKSWFRPGSRIIITTEDESLLNAQMHKKYSPKELNDEEALQLFSYHAFGELTPPEEYYKLSKQAVFLCNGVPKQLEVLGSFLSDKTSEEEWEDMLEKLKRSHPGGIPLNLM